MRGGLITRVGEYAGLLFLFVSLASACTIVDVESPFPTTLSREALELNLAQNKKSFAGATLEIYFGKPSRFNDLPYETLTTDGNGKAVTSELPVATYYLRIRLRESQRVEFGLEVPVRTKLHARKNGFDLTAAPLERVPDSPLACPGGCPITSNKTLSASLEILRGVVMDPTDAFIPKMEIVLYKANDPKHAIAKLTTDDRGQFSSDLAPGKYLVTFHRLGFVEQHVMVSIGTGGWKGLQLNLGIASCGATSDSKIAELS